MRELTESEKQQVEKIEKILADNKIKNEGMYIFKNPLPINLKGKIVNATRGIIGYSPMDKGGVAAYINFFEREKVIGIATFIPDEANRGDFPEADIENFSLRDYKLSGFQKVLDNVGDVDSIYYQNAIQRFTDEIEKCKSFLN